MNLYKINQAWKQLSLISIEKHCQDCKRVVKWHELLKATKNGKLWTVVIINIELIKNTSSKCLCKKQIEIVEECNCKYIWESINLNYKYKKYSYLNISLIFMIFFYPPDFKAITFNVIHYSVRQERGSFFLFFDVTTIFIVYRSVWKI